MNFKTTLVLIVLLAVAAVALFFTRERGGETETTADATSGGDGKKLIDVSTDKVTKVTIAPAMGDKFTLEKSGTEWKLTEPVAAPAETWEVDPLLRSIAEARSRGALKDADADAGSASTGLDQPSYRVELVAGDETHTLNVGARTAVGGNVYVSTGDGKEVHVVAADLVDQLEKPFSSYRKTQLVDVPSAQVKQLTVKDGERTLRAEKHGEDWQLVEPAKMPAEKSAIDDLIFAVTGLRAVEYVSENASADAAKYQLNAPRLSVTLSTQAPATQPATATTAPATQEAPRTVLFGRYDDVLKKNLYATVAGSTSVAKVAATVLDTFNKKPLDLRDKRVVNIDPEQVSKFSFTSDLAATTQPTSRPASKRTVSLRRRAGEPASAGGAATAPSTTPATTQASTQPAPELSTWELLSDPKGEAADAKVTALLNALHPLRVEKYLEAIPTTQAAPIATHTINVTTEAAGGAGVKEHQIRLIDRGSAASGTGGTDPKLLGEYNGLAFELDRAILRQLEGEFNKGAAGSSPAPVGDDAPPANFPPFPTGP